MATMKIQTATIGDPNTALCFSGDDAGDRVVLGDTADHPLVQIGPGDQVFVRGKLVANDQGAKFLVAQFRTLAKVLSLREGPELACGAVGIVRE